MDEELRYLTEHDIIDLPHIRQVIEMEKRKESVLCVAFFFCCPNQ